MNRLSVINTPWSRRWHRLATVLLLACTSVLPPTPVAADATTVEQSLARLGQATLDELPEVLDALSQEQDPRIAPTLQALLDGKLFVVTASGQIVRDAGTTDAPALIDVVSAATHPPVERAELKKVSTNNALRTRLREALGRLRLSAADAQTRLQAIKTLIASDTEDAPQLLRNRLEKETDTDVRTAIATGLAFVELRSEDKAKRLQALTTLESVQTQDVRTKLQALLERNAEGEYSEPDTEVRKVAARLLDRIDRRMQRYQFLETVYFGLSLGSILVLASIGLAITFGVMGVINMAHGELMMLGAYTTYSVQQALPHALDYSLFIAIPAAFIVAALVGIAIERGIIQFLYGRPLETLLATFGVSLVLQQAVRSIYSPLNRSVATPSWMSGSWAVNDMLSLTYNRLYIVAFSLLVFVLLTQLLKRTRLGLEVRAVAQNRTMARAMGIPTRRVDMMTFGLGSGIAGVAGVALSQLTNVGPNLGQAYIVDTFMVVVFGGVGNLWGTLVGGLALGIVNKILEPAAGAVLAKILVLVFIILFIQKRPRGLFPQKGRAAEA